MASNAENVSLWWGHHGQMITSIRKCGMKLLIHSQISTVAPLKFVNGPMLYWSYNYLSMLGSKLNYASKMGDIHLIAPVICEYIQYVYGACNEQHERLPSRSWLLNIVNWGRMYLVKTKAMSLIQRWNSWFVLGLQLRYMKFRSWIYVSTFFIGACKCGCGIEVKAWSISCCKKIMYSYSNINRFWI